MEYPLPTAFFPQLALNHLALVASWLLDELYATEDDLTRDTDDNYTRGCTTFMRQRLRILKEAMSGKHPWLGIATAGNDLVFTVDGLPCRYSNDDPDNPKKDAVTLANSYQQSLFDYDDFQRPQRFCFVIDRGLEGISDPHVEFVGFTPIDTIACRWISSSVRNFQIVGETTPAAVPVAKPTVAPKRRPADDDAVAEQS
ncbi:hypothetical protein E4T66_20130 [Sinimarinibacterium sp. CAU 1509]|uniref:hypothetical protein n=1 Tax=Sinimarinibacterium sp. CAU 1509 TaxID=2562283 RepID=UPI0010AC3154|nr:hypothetical protein [Sinimarinibacterium sp. CAU 1509]TJY56268.1 hypothetical protein E4T66_20130 [Sinimarinibacterium sp. CAU 1509]